MKRPRRRTRIAPVLTHDEKARVEALTVAMALAPGVYARNRMFDLFAGALMQRAKARAASLRGIVKQLGRASDLTLSRVSPTPEVTGEPAFVLRYQIVALRLTRVIELSRVELATLRMLAANASVATLPSDALDRTLVETVLARLLGAGGEAGHLAQAAQDRATPSTPPPVQ